MPFVTTILRRIIGASSERFLSKNSMGVRIRLAIVVCSVTALTCGGAFGQVGQTWTGTGGDGLWSNAANWGGVLPTPGDTTSLTFGVNSGTSILNQDLGAPFVLNTLQFNRSNTSSQYAIGGGDLLFAGTNAAITFSGTTTTLGVYTQTIATNVIIGGDNLSLISTSTNGNILRLTGTSITTTGNTVTLTLGGSSLGANTIFNSIQNDISLQKTGTGLWVLSGNNTFTGGVSVQSGILRITNTNALGLGTDLFLGSTNSSGNISFSAPAGNLTALTRTITLAGLSGTGIGIISSDGTPTSTVSIAGTILAEGAARTLQLAGTNTNGVNVIDALITDGGGTLGLLKSAAVTWALTNTNNNFTGGVTVSGGALRLALTNGALQGIGANNVRFAGAGGAQAVLESNGTLTLNVGSGTGELQWGATTSNGGGFAAAGGTLTVLLNAAGDTNLIWNVTTGFTRTGSELQFGSTTADSLVDFQNPINLSNGVRTIRLVDNATSAGDAVMLSGTISSAAGGGLLVNGSGTLILTGTNTYSQGTTLAAAGVNVVLRNDSVLGTGTITGIGGQFIADTTPITISNDLLLTNAIAFGGSQTLTLSGLTTVSGTSRTITANNTAGTIFTNTVSIGTTAGLTLLNFAGAASSTLFLNGNLVNGVSTGGVTYTNANFVLGGINTYSGGTTILSGRVIFGGQEAFGSGTLALNGGTLAPTASVTITNLLTIGGNATVTGAGVDLAFDGPGMTFITAATTTLNTGVNSLTFSDEVQARGNWTILGGNTVTLQQGMSFTGPAALTLLANNTGGVVINNGINLSPDGTNRLATLRGAGTGGLTVNGSIIDGSGVGSILLQTGTFNINGTNTYTGGTTLSVGTLIIGNDAALGTGVFTVVGLTSSVRTDTNAHTLANDVVVAGSFSLTGGPGVQSLTLGGNVTVSGGNRTITFGNLTTTSSFYLTGSLFLGETGTDRTLTLAGASGTNVVLSGNIVNGTGATAGAVVYAGPNVLITGTNTYGGGTTISGGRVTVNDLATAFGTGGVTFAGGTFAANLSGTLPNNLTLSGTVTFTGPTTDLIVDGSGINRVIGATTMTNGFNSLTLVDEMRMGANWTITSGGLVTLQSVLSITGPTAQTLFSNNAGGLILNDGINLSADGTNHVLTLRGAGLAGLTVNGLITDTGAVGSVTFLTGTFNINGTNSYTGGSTLRAGTLIVGNDLALGTGILTVTGTQGLLRADGSPRTLNNNVVVGGNFTITGAQSLTLGGSVTVSGANRTITFSNSSVANPVFLTGPLFLGETGTDRTLILQGSANAKVVLAGNIVSGTGAALGSITYGPAAEYVISGTNTYGGGTAVTGGTLSLASNSAFGTGVVTWTGGTLRSDAAPQQVNNSFALLGNITLSGVQPLNLSGTITVSGGNRQILNGNATTSMQLSGGTIVLGDDAAARVLTLTGAAGGNLVVGSTISDGAVAGGSLIIGGGTVLLSASNNYTGPTSIVGGAVTLGSDSPFGSGAVFWSGGTIQPDGTPRTLTNSSVTLLGNVAVGGAQQLALSGTLIATAARTVTITNPAGLLLSTVLLSPTPTAFVLTFNGPGPLTVTGAITQNTTTNAGVVLSNTGGATFLSDNTYFGNTTVNAGVTLTLGNGVGTSGNLSGTLNLIGGVLELNYGAMTTYGLTSTANITGAGGSVEINGAAGGGVIFDKVNTYTGVTTITQGTLRMGVANALASASSIVVNSTGTWDLNGFSVAVTSLSEGVGGPGAIVSNTGAAVLTVQQGFYSGAVTGTNLGFQKTGLGTLTLSNANQFTAPSTLVSGTLILANDLALGTADLRVTGSITLQSASTPLTLTNNITLAGNLAIAGTNNVSLVSTLTLVQTAARTLTVNNTGTTFVNGITATPIVNRMDLIINVTDNAHLFIGNVSRNTGTIGVVTVTGGNGIARFTGSGNAITHLFMGGNATAILQGGNNSLSLSTTAAVLTMSNNAVLSLSGVNQSFTNINSIFSTNRITNSSNAEAVITVNAGSYAGLIENGTGTIAVNKVSSGTLILAHDNTFNGLITIAAGTLQIGAGGATGSVQAASITNSGALIWNSTASVNYGGNITGTGTLTVTGGGSYVFSGATVNYTGTTTVGNNTTVTFGAGSVRTSANAITVLNNATLNLQVGASLGSGPVSLANGSRLTGVGTLGGIVTANLGSDIFAGGDGTAGTLTLGNLTLAGGALNFDLGTSSDLLRVMSTTQPNVTTASIINILSGTGFGAGSYTLLSGYTGQITATSLGFLTVNGPSGYSFALTNTIGSLNIDFTAALQKIWTGSNGNIWDVNSTANFTLSGSITPTVYVDGDAVIFDDTAIVTDVTISNGGVAVVPTSVLVVNTAQTYTFRGDPIGGGNGLDKQGTGILVLVNDNTFTGAIQVSGGTLQLGEGGATGSITPTLGIQLENNSTLLINRSGTISLSGNISGSGNLVKIGSGVLDLYGSNTYLGHTTITGGTVQVRGGTLPNNAAGAITVSGNGSQLTFLTPSVMTVPTLTVANQGQVNVNTTNVLITTLNMASGTININAASLTATNLTLVGTAGQMIVFNTAIGTTLNLPTNITYDATNNPLGAVINGPGTLDLTAVRNITVSDSAAVGVNDPELTIGAVMTAASVFNKLGAGMLYLTGSNAISGQTTLSAGTLMIGNDRALGAATVNLMGGTLRGDGTARTLSNVFNQRAGLTIGGSSDLTFTNNTWTGVGGNFTLVIDNQGRTTFSNYILAENNQGRTQTIAGSGAVQFDLISAGVGTTNDNLIFNGTGTYDLMGANTMSGVTSVRNGTVRVFNQGAFGPTPGQAVVLGGGGVVNPMLLTIGALDLTNNLNVVTSSAGSVLTFGNLSAVTSTFSGSISLGSSAVVTTTDGGTVVISGTMSGAGGITKTGPGTLVLTGINSFSGTSTIAGGTLRVGSAAALGNGGRLGVNLSSTLDVNGFAVTLTALNNGVDGGGAITSGTAGPVELIVRTGLFGGAIQDGAGTLSLNKTGTGTLVLAGDSTYTGVTTISAGTLQIGNGTAAGSIVSQTIVNNGILVLNRTDSINYGGVISGTGSVQLSAGQLTLNGTNSYGGATQLASGSTLIVNGALGTSTVAVAGGATLGGGGSLGGPVNVASSGALSGTLTIAGTVSSSGSISPGSLGGIGTVTLNALILNGGTLNFDLGTIGLGNGDRMVLTGAAAPTISATTSFNFNALAGFGVGTYNLITSYTGSITTTDFGRLLTNSVSGYELTLQNNSGSLDLLVALLATHNLNWTGSANGSWDTTSLNWAGAVTTFTNGQSHAIFDDGTAVNNITVTAAGVQPISMTVNNDSAHNYLFTGGDISGFTATSSLYKNGTGTLALANNVSFSGGAVIDGGVLNIGNGGTSGAFTGNIVNNALVAFNRTDGLTYSQQISGTGDVSILTGSVTFGAAQNYSGATTVASGAVLQAVSGLASATVNVAGLMQFNTNATQTYAGVLAGSGFLQKLGTGTTALTGANTFNGITSIDAGTLLVNQALSGTVYVNAGGTFSGTGSSSSFMIINGGAGSITGTQTGNLDVNSGVVTIASGGATTGTIDVGGGSLLVQNGGSVGNTFGVNVSAGTLNVNSGGAIVGSGQTAVSGGTLIANGNVSGLVVVSGGGVLQGNGGTVGAAVLNSGGVLSPGNSVGTLTVDGSGVSSGASLTLNGGSNVVFEFNNATGTFGGGGSGGWDYVDLVTSSGTLFINATFADKIQLRIDSLTFPGNIHGTSNNFNNAPGSVGNVQEYFWKFVGVTDSSKIVAAGAGSINGRFTITDAAPNNGVFFETGSPNGNPFERPISSLGKGTFKVLDGDFGSGYGLYVYYSAVPEPSSMILAGLGSLAAGWYGRRRLRKQANDLATAAAHEPAPPSTPDPNVS